MHRQSRKIVIIALVMSVVVHARSADDAPVALGVFRVEGTPWLYAKVGDMEILSRASSGATRLVAATVLRGKRLCPDFLTAGRPQPLLLIVADSPSRTVNGLKPGRMVEADGRRWSSTHQTMTEVVSLCDERTGVKAINLGGTSVSWMIGEGWNEQGIRMQRPAFAEWVTTGLFGVAGPLSEVIGVPHTTTVRLPRLSWPDEAVAPGEFPKDAADFPAFSKMFDPARKADGLSSAERTKFQFQTALFARWSLFGPVTNGRNRNGYWAFAELARRNGATEALFRECYGMDWAQACAEMRAYLKPKNVGMLEVRMPHVMADVPEVERLKFRDATLEEVRRILGELNRLRAAEEAKRDRTKEDAESKPAN